MPITLAAISLSLPAWILLCYLGVINVLTFALYGVDKAKAYSNARRIPEKTLWLFALLGGSLGAILGMKCFHHKTRKASFQFIFSLILLIQTVAVVGILWLLRG